MTDPTPAATARDLPDADDPSWYIETRIGSENYRGEDVRFIWDRRGQGKTPVYLNVTAELFMRSVLARAAAETPGRVAALEAVAAAAATFVRRWDDRKYSDAADMVGHCWESIGALRDALAAIAAPAPAEACCEWYPHGHDVDCAAPAPTPSEPVARCGFEDGGLQCEWTQEEHAGLYDERTCLHAHHLDCHPFTPGARDE